MSTVSERLIGWLLGSIARTELSAGAAIFVACVPVFTLFSDTTVARAIAGILMQVGGAFVVAGATSAYLSRSRRWLLPNERVTTAANGRPAVGGWLMALGVTLVAAPAWLLL